MGDSDEEDQQQGTDVKAELPEYFTRRCEIREDLYENILRLAAKKCKEHKLQKDIAQSIKQDLDTDLDMNELIGKGPWQVHVGRSFAAAITHESGHLAFFDLPKHQETFLVYKSLAVQSI
eukprot:TRINITY_DN97916_c0_g1_i1.p1 TRINITY_DN97916_c0_g1~~TRINITY_DN97916_c0_g1_i1.p1  ORF type:complete len:120 (-),score=27.73 TRINITY_DN97916_c0_g1_i1:122-481(-)